jgi:hypothetical protein
VWYIVIMKPVKSPVKSYEPSELFGLRMMVMLEHEPQSDHYHQMMFSQEQFKKISDFIADTLGKKQCEDHGVEEVKLVIGGDCVFIHGGKDYYSEEELEDNEDKDQDEVTDDQEPGV